MRPSRAIAICGILACTLALASVPAWAGDQLMMATTTSTDDTGLLNYLAPLFQKDTGIELKWTATGTGKALELGKNCDVDVVLVHAPGAEKKFVESGAGLNRRQVMYNDFVLLGPAGDPAGIKGQSMAQALATLRAGKALFVSRGDKSGTHMLELGLWKTTGGQVPEKESWYLQAGQGMYSTLTMAAEKKAYTLCDRGTFLKFEADHQGHPPLAVLLEGEPELLNQYSVIEINPAACPQAKQGLAKRFSDWLASPRGQKLVADFKVHGKQLFTPNAQ
ncbi:MAG: substrate-binding domain-containing protein [Pseudomonadota bacterium]